jgi:hypothetical protein
MPAGAEPRPESRSPFTGTVVWYVATELPGQMVG